RVEKHDLIMPTCDGFGLRHEAGSVISTALGCAGAARCGTGVLARYPYRDRRHARLEVIARRAANDEELVLFGRAHAEEGFGGEHERPHVERTAFDLRKPVAVGKGELADGLNEGFFWHLGHRHPARRIIESARVFIWTE